mmetsp:Transcript_143423/g.275457  ORF Transcript_143423/g.275457 Transcript_143423/m.275457 type:complete len:340 (-) Transcript_143423:197-1216(-)
MADSAVVFRIGRMTIRLAFLVYLGHGGRVARSWTPGQEISYKASAKPFEPLATLLLTLEPATAFNPLPNLQISAADHCRPAVCRGGRPHAARMTEAALAPGGLNLSRRAVAASLLSVLAGLIPQEAHADDDGLAVAYFTAGDPRFLERGFDQIKYKGVKRSEVGSLVTAEGSIPAIKVFYKSEKVSYKRVLGAFWRSIDPTDAAKQFGVAGPSIVWTASDEEQAAAEASRSRLDASTRYQSSTFGPMFKGKPIKTEIRPLAGEWQVGKEADQGWYLKEDDAYQKALKKTGRGEWLEEAYKAVTVTACQTGQEGGGKVCGYVYFPCSEENGCTAVMNGNV